MNLQAIAAYPACALLVATTAFAPATAASTAAPTALSAPASTTGTAVMIPGGTNVMVSLSVPVSSANATVGDHVALVVRKEVDVNGWCAIAQGANGQGTIVTATHSGGNGRGGKLAIHIDWVFAVDGQKVLLSNVDHPNLSTDKKGAASTATIAGSILLMPLGLGVIGLFAHNWVRGKDVTLDATKTYPEFVDQTIQIIATAKAT